MPVAVNWANTSFSPVAGSTARTSTTFWPAAGPRVRKSWARPSLLVMLEPANMLPPPATTTKFTSWPFKGLSLSPVARTTNGSGSSVPTGPLWPWPETMTRSGGMAFGPGATGAVGVAGTAAGGEGQAEGSEDWVSHDSLPIG